MPEVTKKNTNSKPSHVGNMVLSCLESCWGGIKVLEYTTGLDPVCSVKMAIIVSQKKPPILRRVNPELHTALCPLVRIAHSPSRSSHAPRYSITPCLEGGDFGSEP